MPPAGLLDELIISIVPVFLGSGVRLLDDRDLDGIALEVFNVIDAPGVTHVPSQASCRQDPSDRHVPEMLTH